MQTFLATFLISLLVTLSPLQRAVFIGQNTPTTGGIATSIAFVPGSTHQCYAQAVSGTTLSCTVSGATSGNTLVVFTGSSDVYSISIVDSGRGTVAPCSINPVTWLVSTNGHATCFTIANIGAGSNVITTTFGSSVNFPYLQVMEFSGADIATPQDVSVGNSGTGGTTMTSGSISTSGVNEMLVAFCQVAAGGPVIVPGSGFTLIPTVDSNIASEYLFEPTVGTYQGTCTGQSTGQDWVVTMVVLK